MSISLIHQKILVTRPAHQADNLCHLIIEAGGEAIRFPAMEITDIQDKSELHAYCAHLDLFDIAIFISANAVEYALATLLNYNIPETLTFFAVGKKTASILNEKGITVLSAPPPFNSESLLTLLELQETHIQGKKVLIFKGEGGRELLADSLQQRGAQVNAISVYQRNMPSTAMNLTQVPDMIVITSTESVENVFLLLSKKSWLKTTPLVVIGQRVAEYARQFTQAPIVIATTASDEGLLNAMLELGVRD
jgi:uroporphyrinogen-III synthase